MMCQKIELYIVRHGERQDEAIMKEFYSRQRSVERNLHRTIPDPPQPLPPPPPPHTDSLDPLLTARGHAQAHESFAKLTKTLMLSGDRKKIAMFCSPLRRVVGTALMVGTVPINNKMLEFPSLLYDDRSDGNDDDDDDDGTIPITILNDLGNFAAAIYKRGGMQELVPKGFIRCAASMEANDGTATSPFARAVTSMPTGRMKVRANFKSSKPVCFWRYHKDETISSCCYYLPMSKPLYPGSKDEGPHDNAFSYPSTRNNNNKVSYTKNAPRPPQQPTPPPPNNPLLSVDKAVKMTANRGYNVCVIVAHRETIRDMAERCNYFGSLSMPYCCIGSFAASVVKTDDDGDGDDGDYSNNTTTVDYHFHNVWSTEKFDTQAIPRYFPRLTPGISRLTSTPSSAMFMVPGDEAPHYICTVRSTLNEGWFGSQIWLSNTKKLKTSRVHQKRNRSEKSHCLQMDIVAGHEEWENYWTKYRGAMKGWAGWELPNGRVSILELELETTAQINETQIGRTVRELL